MKHDLGAFTPARASELFLAVMITFLAITIARNLDAPSGRMPNEWWVFFLGLTAFFHICGVLMPVFHTWTSTRPIFNEDWWRLIGALMTVFFSGGYIGTFNAPFEYVLMAAGFIGFGLYLSLWLIVKIIEHGKSQRDSSSPLGTGQDAGQRHGGSGSSGSSGQILLELPRTANATGIGRTN